MDKEFKVGDLVKIKKGTPKDWGRNCYVIDIIDDNDMARIEHADGYYVWHVLTDLEHYKEDEIAEILAENIIEQTRKRCKEQEEVEELLMNNDKELRTKAELYDKICDKLFMATGIIEDGDSIQYIIDPEIIINEIIKIITEIPFSRETQREKKRSFVRSIRGTDW